MHLTHRHPLVRFDNTIQRLQTAKIVDLIATPVSAYFDYGFKSSAEYAIENLTKASIDGYGRDLEREADQSALRIMQTLGVDTARSMDVFNVFVAEYSSDSATLIVQKDVLQQLDSEV